MARELKSRVPEERRPQPRSTRTLTRCGPTGRLVECEYKDQRFPWGLYEQSGHAGMALVRAETLSGERIALVRQWRPADADAIELPAGNIGQGHSNMIKGMLVELREEVHDEIEVVSIRTCPGFVHDIGREVVPEGGGKCFFFFVINVRCETPSMRHKDRHEATRSRWHSPEEIRQMVRDHVITDSITLFFLRDQEIIESDDFGWFDLEIPA